MPPAAAPTRLPLAREFKGAAKRLGAWAGPTRRSTLHQLEGSVRSLGRARLRGPAELRRGWMQETRP
jgi:hypothetical protein